MRAFLLGCPIDVLSMDQTVDLARQAMRTKTRLQHVALNVAKLVNMHSDPLLNADVRGSDIIGIDGMGILVAARLCGIPARQRVSGVDLLTELLVVCAEEGFRPYFLGATPEVLEKAVANARVRHPSLTFAGSRDGYFRPDQELEVVKEIRESGADCLFIGMPTPRKERFLAAYRDVLDVPFIMGVGGSLDILSGKVRRAPAVMQMLGLEWVYRVYQEPGRMWWRYTRTNTIFAGMMLRAIAHRFAGEPTTATEKLKVGSE